MIENNSNQNVTQSTTALSQVSQATQVSRVIDTSRDSDVDQQAVAQTVKQAQNNQVNSETNGSSQPINSENTLQIAPKVAATMSSQDVNHEPQGGSNVKLSENLAAINDTNNDTKQPQTGASQQQDGTVKPTASKEVQVVSKQNQITSNVQALSQSAVQSVAKTAQDSKATVNQNKINIGIKNQHTPISKSNSDIDNPVRYTLRFAAVPQARDANDVPNRSLGIDISDYQDTSIVNEMKNKGDKFVIVKVSEGLSNGGATSAGDKIKAAENAGMEVQGYHFARFGGDTNEAVKEAVHAVANAEYYGLPKGSYLACDYEAGASGSVSANTNAIIAWMNKVKESGYTPLLYSGAYYLKLFKITC